MSEKQTEAQRLADALASRYPLSNDVESAAAELRRLDEVNRELLDAAKKMQSWVLVLLNTLGAELEGFEMDLSNSKTGDSVKLSLKEHFDVATTSITKAEATK